MADITGDGKPDIVMVGLGGPAPRLGVLPGNGDGTFQAVHDVALSAPLIAPTLIDLDGNGVLDLLGLTQTAVSVRRRRRPPRSRYVREALNLGPRG